MNCTHVIEVRVYNATDDEVAALVSRYATEECDIRWGKVEATFDWPSRQVDDDKPSGKQVNYARRLWFELKDLVRTEKDLGLAERAQELLKAINFSMQDAEVSRKTASAAIDALNEAIAELMLSQTGAISEVATWT